MRILYGVVGEGMGHATRSRVVLEHLLAAGHEVRVVVSGRAHGFLSSRFTGRSNIRFEEIHGLVLGFEGNALDKSETFRLNLESLPAGLLKNIAVYRKVAEDAFQPEIVISDFETWAYLYGLNHHLPVISIDNMQVLNRCRHSPEVTEGRSGAFRLAKGLVKGKLPFAWHYLVASFFFPPVRKKKTTLVPPILRPEILAAKREPGSHILVYQTATTNTALIPTLQSLPYEFRLYGMGREGQEGNVRLKAFSEQGFIDDLRTARAAIAGGGFSLMGEAVHLHVPLMSLPIEGQFEQVLNARYLEKLGYGAHAERLDPEGIAAFIARSDEHAHALSRYAPHDNGMLFGCVDELLRRVADGEDAPAALDAPAMGKWSASDPDGERATGDEDAPEA